MAGACDEGIDLRGGPFVLPLARDPGRAAGPTIDDRANHIPVLLAVLSGRAVRRAERQKGGTGRQYAGAVNAVLVLLHRLSLERGPDLGVSDVSPDSATTESVVQGADDPWRCAPHVRTDVQGAGVPPARRGSNCWQTWSGPFFNSQMKYCPMSSSTPQKSIPVGRLVHRASAKDCSSNRLRRSSTSSACRSPSSCRARV